MHFACFAGGDDLIVRGGRATAGRHHVCYQQGGISIVPDNKINSYTKINYEKTGKGIKDVKSLAKQIRESDLSKALIQEYYSITVNEAIKLAEERESGSKNSRQVIKEVLYNKTTDTILWGIALEYHKKLFMAGKFGQTVDYLSATVDTLHTETLTIEPVRGKPITVKQKQVGKLMFDFKIKDVVQILEQNLATDNSIEAIAKVFENNYFRSLDYIQRVFELEKCITGNNCTVWKEENNIDTHKAYVGFKTLLSTLSNIEQKDKERLFELRKSAFHTHIPKEGTYEEGIEIIENYLRYKGCEFWEWKKKTDDDDD